MAVASVAGEAKPGNEASASTIVPSDQSHADKATPSSAQPPPQNDTAEPSTSQSKPFQKSSLPPLPLHFYLQPEIPHAEAKTLRLLIKKSGGVPESRFGKADYIVVDPRRRVQALKLQRESLQIGQPIPVVTLDYVLDSSKEGHLLDRNDPKYSLDSVPSASNNGASNVEITYPSGRRPYLATEIEEIIEYFVQRGIAYSHNAASHDLAHRIPHTQSSIQTFLRDNFAKGMNLKERVSRQSAQAAAHSDSLSHARPQPTPTSRSVPALDDEEEDSADDIEVRPARPDAAAATVDRRTPGIPSPNDSSRRTSAVIRQTAASSKDLFRGGASNDEESEPEDGWEYSALRTKSAKDGPSNKPAKQEGVEGSSEDDSEEERDELEPGAPVRQTRGTAVSDDGSEYRARSSQRDPNSVRKGTRTLYSEADKKALVHSLVALAHGANVDLRYHEEYLKRPSTDFWDDFATRHDRHTSSAWQSHYAKNRETYFKMIKVALRLDEEAESEEEEERDEAGDTERVQVTDTATSVAGQAQVGDRPETGAPSKSSSDRIETLPETDAPQVKQAAKQQPLTGNATPTRHLEWEDARVLPSPPPREEGEQEDMENDDDADEMLAVEAEIPATPRTMLQQTRTDTINEEADLKSSSKVAGSREDEELGLESEEEQRPRAKVELSSTSDSASDSDESEVDELDLSRSRHEGIPMNPDHRSAAFLDLTIDSEEEARLAHAQPRERTSSEQSASDIPSQPLVSPSGPLLKSHLRQPLARAHPSKADRTRDWARSLSNASSEELLPSSVSRSRKGDRTAPVGPSSHHATETHLSRSRSGPITARRSDILDRRKDRVATERYQESVLKDAQRQEAEKQKYRRQFKVFCRELGMNKDKAYSVLIQFEGNIPEAFSAVTNWCQELAVKYEAGDLVALDYLKAANGNFAVAESCMMVAARTRSQSSLKRSASSRDIGYHEERDVLSSKSKKMRRRTDYR